SYSELQMARIPSPQRHFFPQNHELQWVEPRESRQ
ncbi:lytic transglycosylase domain-containing protein, partial [Salmonella enterica]|nr:lytic transglycosylase domain-containing protein [Salmonella enterica]EBC2122795.1 lytic transglycosylase domain-containing protein [Salmonella enterica]